MRYSNKLRTRRYGIVVRQGVVRIEPNESCPCGSGRKYKKCCRAATGLGGWLRRWRARRIKAKAAAD